MKGRAVLTAIALALSSFAILATGATGVAPAGAGLVAEVVSPATLVTQPAATGWGFQNESGTTGSGALVVGPDAPPLGQGSVQLNTAVNADGYAMVARDYAGTRLDQLTELSYWTHQTASPKALSLQLSVKYRPTDDAFGGRLVYEPYQNNGGTVPTNTWTQWDALNGGNGLWWASNTLPENNPSPPRDGSNGNCPQSSPCTWDQILTLFPDATIDNGGTPGDGQLLFKAGSAWGAYSAHADALAIGVDGVTTTYDFEPGCTTTCYVDGTVATSGDGHEANPFKTIQEGLNAVAIDGDVIVAAGTYDEHVTINKSLTLTGAGDTTVIDPSTDGPAITVTAGGTSETDRLVLRSLQTSGASGGRPNGQGIKLAVPTAAGHITLMNVTSTGNTGDGLLQNGVGALEDIVVESSSFSGNAYGGYAVTSGAGEITKFRVDNSHFDDNGTWGWSVFIATSGVTRPTFTDVVVEDSTFNGNGHKGIYLERLDNAVLQRLEVVGSGDGASLPEPGFTAHAAGVDINLKYRAFSNIQLLDSTITGSGAGDATNGGALLFKQRDDAPSYSSPAATVDAVTISGNTISDNPVTGIRFGEPGKTNAGPTDAHVNQNTISNNTGIGFNAANTSVAIDGECNFYGTDDGPSGEGPGTGDDVSENVDFTPWKIAADSTCPPVAPGAPTITEVEAQDEAVTITFTPPADTGGALIDEYEATCATEVPEGTRSATGASSPIEVDDLENGTLYVCFVVARTSAGDSGWSNLKFVTPATVPDKPTNPSVVRVGTDAQVSFDAPAFDGGSPITSYTATCTDPDDNELTGTGASSPVTVSGLALGTNYDCTVHATNSAGNSEESDEVILTSAIGTLTGSVLDLAPPKGLETAFAPPAEAGVIVCPDGEGATCDDPAEGPAGLDGTYVVEDLLEGDYDVTPYFRKDATSARVFGTTSSVFVAAIAGADAGTSNVGFRPDSQARPVNGHFKGSNTYFSSAATAPVSGAKIAGTKTFQARFDNDGNLPETINLKATATGKANFSVTYRMNGVKVSNIAGKNGKNITLEPGESRTITATVKSKAGAPTGSQLNATFRATSRGQATDQKVDFVRIRATKK